MSLRSDLTESVWRREHDAWKARALAAEGRLRTGQAKAVSLVESVLNVAIGLGVALLAQLMVVPLFDIHVPLAVNLQIAGWFTVISIVRSYWVRRLFNWLHTR